MVFAGHYVIDQFSLLTCILKKRIIKNVVNLWCQPRAPGTSRGHSVLAY